MKQHVRNLAFLAPLVILAACGATQQTAMTGSGGPAQTVAQADPTLDADARAALASLYLSTPHAQDLGDKALGILVFPQVVRAGFIAGAAHGAGILYEHGNPTGSYATTSATFGMQAGVQQYGYAMFFMNAAALNDLKTSSNFSVGVAPTIVIADQGTARNLDTTTIQASVYAFIFNQQGLMAGLGLAGTKITKIRDFSPS